MVDVERSFNKIIRKLGHSGYNLDVYFDVHGGRVVSLRRCNEWCAVYIIANREIFERYRNIVDSSIHYLNYNVVYYVDIVSQYDVYLHKITKLMIDNDIIGRCKRYIRMLSSISEGQWFDHIRSREKFHGRATVELIRVIRVLEEIKVVEPVWRKWGMGSQHTLKVIKKLSKGELLYYLLRLLNVAIQDSLRK